MQMDKLWAVAKTSMKTSKNARAEKALLSILKFDETNAAAYNRLGILYAKSQKFDEAIECFEIAQSLDDNPSSLHNVGLIYLETGSFDKAVIAFEQALEMEGDIPTRFIALAKAYEKLGRRKDALEALENAYELNHNVTTLRQILALHEIAEDHEAIAATTARIEQQLAENAEKRTKKKIENTATAKQRPRRILRRPAATHTATKAGKITKVTKPATKTTKPTKSTNTTKTTKIANTTRAIKPDKITGNGAKNTRATKISDMAKPNAPKKHVVRAIPRTRRIIAKRPAVAQTRAKTTTTATKPTTRPTKSRRRKIIS